ncbi:GNAT family N-acetyltransferase [Vibrio sonorensis]|uniref:GNAT family N-acetyltransferase n=1 Tax=Vibrio sonorensis TaxID=1004316 RepID=UPI001FE0597A|nr:GNAT family N-acetyltransferase [Vibrio sonorensis]
MGGDLEWQYNALLNLVTESPEAVSIYVVYQDGKPVTSAWLTFNGDSPFAGIWGGSTLEEYRGRGYYSSLLNKRIEEAKARGKQYLIIDASEMSRPIVEKHGFKLVAQTTGYSSPD